MTIVRIGATKKYSDGWEAAFTKGKKAPESGAAAKKSKPAKASVKKKAAKKSKKK